MVQKSIRKKRFAEVDRNRCVSCGECNYQCPRNAISMANGIYANVDINKCIGCGICARSCPVGCISIVGG